LPRWSWERGINNDNNRAVRFIHIFQAPGYDGKKARLFAPATTLTSLYRTHTRTSMNTHTYTHTRTSIPQLNLWSFSRRFMFMHWILLDCCSQIWYSWDHCMLGPSSLIKSFSLCNRHYSSSSYLSYKCLS
jgi:hypothetical protein